MESKLPSSHPSCLWCTQYHKHNHDVLVTSVQKRGWNTCYLSANLLVDLWYVQCRVVNRKQGYLAANPLIFNVHTITNTPIYYLIRGVQSRRWRSPGPTSRLSCFPCTPNHQQHNDTIHYLKCKASEHWLPYSRRPYYIHIITVDYRVSELPNPP